MERGVFRQGNLVAAVAAEDIHLVVAGNTALAAHAAAVLVVAVFVEEGSHSRPVEHTAAADNRSDEPLVVADTILGRS